MNGAGSGKKTVETVIRPAGGWFSVDWRELFRYKDLLVLLIWREFASKYKQTILGPLWFILQPLLMTAVFAVVFVRVAHVPTNGVPGGLFYLCSLLPWSYFAQSLNATSISLVTNAHMLSKVYFPRLIIPLSVVASNTFSFLIQLPVFLAFYAYYAASGMLPEGVRMNAWVLAVPLVFLQMAAFSLAVGLWIAAMTVRYRDFHYLIGFMVQLWMYVTPVIYPMSIVPQPWKWLLALNPMAFTVEFFRFAFFGSPFDAASAVFSLVMTAAVLFSGVLVFNRVEKTLVDTI